MEKNIYGYVRVSATDQNEDRQLLALRDRNVPVKNIFTDRQSGRDFDRPQYIKMVKKLRRGDLVYVLSIDRLGRNYEEILRQWRVLTKEIGADVSVIDMPLLDTHRDMERDLMSTFISDLVLQILSFVAENERANIRRRQAEGIAAARLRNVHLGRPRLSPSGDFDEIVEAWESKRLKTAEAIEKSGFSESTFYRRVRELRRRREEEN